jgi:hypothetical protein
MLRLWRAVQVGDIPSAVLYYHERVRRVIGVGNIARALAKVRPSVAVLQPRIISVNPTPAGVEVNVRATSAGSSVGIQSFLLRRGDEGWRVGYDTVLGDALSPYLESEIQNGLSPRTNAPLTSEELAGIRLSSTYRTLFLNRKPASSE